MKKRAKNGFTLTEVMVVLVILVIIDTISVPFFLNYWRNAEYRKNESNARSVYLAAESKLTYYRSSGQWKMFESQIEKQGLKAEFLDEGKKKTELENRIYAVTLDTDASEEEREKSLVYQLIGDYTYDTELLNHAIAIEIDIESGKVYSAFYGSKCKGLNYAMEDNGDYLTMQKRTYKDCKKRLLGYYSAEDTVNTVHLKTTQLRITSVNFLNSEKLTLNWSSNMKNSLDVKYEIQFYKNSDHTKLFSVSVIPYEMRCKEGWSETSTGTQSTVMLEVKDGNESKKEFWSFPVSYKEGKYTLVLDAMMSAKLQAVIESKTGREKTELEKTLSTSITRLSEIVPELSRPQDIYASVQAVPYGGKSSALTEYRVGKAVKSETTNTLYADDPQAEQMQETEVKITTFRHLSNIRYFSEDTEICFILGNKNMDWASAETGVYDLEQTQTRGTDDVIVQKITWKENSEENRVDFPVIPQMSQSHILKGNKTQITNLQLGMDSVSGESEISDFNSTEYNTSHFLGVFCENKGVIQDVSFRNATLRLDKKLPASSEFNQIESIGILTGMNQGDLINIETEADVNISCSEKFRSFGGITGSNGDSSNSSARMDGCIFRGSFKEDENTNMTGNCYGGIAGINYGWISTCTVSEITMDICGIYNSTDMEGKLPEETEITCTAAITGRNETGAIISECQIKEKPGRLTAQYGLLGGIAGFNDGLIQISGSELTTALLEGTGTEIEESPDAVKKMSENAEKNGIKADSDHSVSKKIQIVMEQKGIVGGITAWNGTEGSVCRCVSGNWSVRNQSVSTDDAAGGIIGINVSGQNLGYLINLAAVEGTGVDGDTSCFAGGIIGIQNNSASNGWIIANCVNYGTIYCYNGYYSDGITGLMTGLSGIVQNCVNYGNIFPERVSDYGESSKTDNKSEAGNDALRKPGNLPETKVKLEQPEVTVYEENILLQVLEAETSKGEYTEKNWEAIRTVLRWDSVDDADLYRVVLSGRGNSDVAVKMEDQIRIYENMLNHTVTVQQYVYKNISGKQEEANWQWVWEDVVEETGENPEDVSRTDDVHIYRLNQYGAAIEGEFKTQDDAAACYKVKLQAELEIVRKANGKLIYSLKLPDLVHVETSDGTRITNDNFRITEQAKFQSDHQQNETEKESNYAASDEKVISWINE